MVEPEAPAPPGRFARWYAAMATTRAARLFSRVALWRLDPILLRLTRGRFCSTLVFPTAVLETTGARSGAARQNAVIFFRADGLDYIAASNAGAARHPDWYFNVQAHPDVIFGRQPRRATTVTDTADLARLWACADATFPAFARYRDDAAQHGRTIPLIRLD